MTFTKRTKEAANIINEYMHLLSLKDKGSCSEGAVNAACKHLAKRFKRLGVAVLHSPSTQDMFAKMDYRVPSTGVGWTKFIVTANNDLIICTKQLDVIIWLCKLLGLNPATGRQCDSDYVNIRPFFGPELV